MESEQKITKNDSPL